MTERAVHLPPRGDGSPRSLSAFAVAFALSPANSARISLSCCARASACWRTRLDALLPHLGGERLRTVRIAELDAARLGGRERRLGALRDLGALLLGDGRVDVQHERVGVRDLGHDERHALRHQAGDERDVAGQPVELGHDDRAPVGGRPLQRRLELRPALERIGALGGLDLGEGLGDVVALGGAEALDRGLLAFEAEAGLALLLGAKRGCRRRLACSCRFT